MRIRTERFKTLVILDEVHHAGDALSWGEGVREAFEPATRRLALTGTPFRSDVNPIPFVTYAPGDDGVPRSVADFTYGYAHALADHVVRPVLFMAYSGEMQWRTRAGDEIAARLGEPLTKDLHRAGAAHRARPGGSWIPSVLAAADRRLSEVRRHVPDAGGLVIATDQDSARAYAKLLREDHAARRRPSCCPTRRPASKKIAAFTESEDRWMVAVRMVSEGVDVPRLAVGVYATTTVDPAVLRPGRRPLRPGPRPRRDRVGVPAVGAVACSASPPRWRSSATTCSAARSPTRTTSSPPSRTCSTRRTPARRASDELDAVLRGARVRGPLRPGALRRRRVRPRRGGARRARRRRWTSSASPGLLEPDQVRELLQQRQSDRAKKQKSAAAASRTRWPQVSTHEQLAVLRRELNGLVAAWHHRTGQAHGITHAALRKECGGPAAAVANADQLHARIDRIREWAARKTS